MSEISRRGMLTGVMGIGAATMFSGLRANADSSKAELNAIRAREASLKWSGKVREFNLEARIAEVDLGGTIAKTWIYGNSLPGKLLRVNKSDRVKVAFKNQLTSPTSVHWHGLAIRNDMDGVPGLTTPEVAPGGKFNFDFITPDSGTYWFHPHSGTQLDRGLYAPLIVDDPSEPSKYDLEWIVILDDWTDGVGKNPDQILAQLKAGTGNSSSMGDMGDMGGMGGMEMGGDVSYPLFLINGRASSDPELFTAKPGQRIRLRIINASADTIFNVALSQHKMTITHTDGFPVIKKQTSSLQIGMGERYDAIVTIASGVFPLVAQAIGKTGIARALVRSGVGRVPARSFRPAELQRTPLTSSLLQSTETARLPKVGPDRIQSLELTGSMNPYIWKINGRTYENTKPLTIRSKEIGRLRIRNATMMPHPIHLHGHTFQIGGAGGVGARKDTVLVNPMGRVDVDFAATNPGKWMIHCHNAYHADAGMMTRLEYI